MAPSGKESPEKAAEGEQEEFVWAWSQLEIIESQLRLHYYAPNEA